jgi:prolyl oligopeptidase
MIRVILVGAILLLPSGSRLGAEPAIDYPPSRTVDTVDSYHGQRVADSYRWLEDLGSPETAAWVEEQNDLTSRYLHSLPMRAAFRDRITALWNYPKATVPRQEGGRLWYRKNSGLQPQSVVYYRATLTSPPVMALDPNVLSPDGDIALSQIAPSPDGKFLAYATATGGIDWETVRVRDLRTNRDLSDVVQWVRYSRIAWTHDGKGFFYSRYRTLPAKEKLESPLGVHSLYYHRLGTAQSADRLIFEQSDQPSWLMRGAVTQDGRYLILRTAQGSFRKNRLYFIDFEDPQRPNVAAPVKPLVGAGEAFYRFVGNVDGSFFVLTDEAAPRLRVIKIDAGKPERVRTKTVIPEGPYVMQNALLAAGRIVVQQLVDVQSRVQIYTLDGKKLLALKLPGMGTIRDLSGRVDAADLFYVFTAPLQPATVYVCRLPCRASATFEAADAPFDRRAYETRQLFAVSQDGTRIPYFLTARRNVKQDRENPTLLYGYGGFSTSVTPRYRPDVPAWLELGGIFVTANIRGGGAYGEEWHRAGMMERKQNSFDDFIAVAEDLIRRGYTAPPRLAIQGNSNGGLLVGAVLNQRPDLFAAALAGAGVMDMLRYHRFTAGAAWTAEYGVSTDPEMFSVLIKYSPLHNIRAGVCYPATLVLTADRDDRVVPSHSFKYVAALQRAQGCNRAALVRIEKGSSHHYRPTQRWIAELADSWAFVAAQTGVTPARRASARGKR